MTELAPETAVDSRADQTLADADASDSGDTTPQEPAQSSAVPATDFELLWVDPRELKIGANTRTEVTLDKGLVRSIRRRGVRGPIITRRDEHGHLVVREGQQRTLGAIEAERDRVLVVVEPELMTDEAAREVERIFDQLNENEHRKGISQADELRATQQLLGFDVKPQVISREWAIPRTRVDTMVAVARSSSAVAAVTDGILDLTQAAVLAEFDEDEPAVAVLTECARTDPTRFGHLAQRLRDRREEARMCRDVADKLAEQGVAVIDRPDTLYGGPVRALSELRPTPKTKPGTTLSVKRHEKCPGHAAVLDYYSRRPVEDRVRITYVCTDFAQHGHAERFTSPGAATSGQRGGTMTEEQKAQRRTVIANGKAWDSATTYRLEWLQNFAARKTLPAGAEAWITQMCAQGSHELRKAMEDDHPLALDLLGLSPKSGRTNYNRRATHPIADAAQNATKARATMLNLVMVLAAFEQATDRRRTWDHPSPEMIAYFTYLASVGYAHSDVEKLVLAHAKPAVSTKPTTKPTTESATASGSDTGSAPAQDSATESATDNQSDAEHTITAADQDPPIADDTAPITDGASRTDLPPTGDTSGDDGHEVDLAA